ncbi:helix-turn-helix domain-containing protein [Chryseobacterium sp. G0162]|uniref:helix-turn-helix domain-containing protein n=1 Tax=Chryseobacterium sp. G0162 TaxID=2487063 RepID=UPI001E353830|nr:helix-turn-helix domain-containing protein [Chryseobacterium sp. G0162]
MNIERMEFIRWMEKIMTRFDILHEEINSKQNEIFSIDGEQLPDNRDVLQFLKISSISLQRYRSNKMLPYYKISGKLYYKLSDVHQLIRYSFNGQLIHNLKAFNNVLVIYYMGK